jgi:NADPH:quinone reductase-like Zn-dependent oxidoreductase
MANLPQQQKALFLESKQGAFVIRNHTVPKPGPGQALLQVKAAALNPVDWKIQKYGVYVTDFPAILGTDVSGVIIAVGEGVTKFNVGDKV